MKKGSSPPRTGVNEALVQAAVHPVDRAIVQVLAERGSASGKGIAAEISKPRSTVGDRLRMLEADGLIESVAEDAKRGTVERFYRLTASAHWLEDEEVGRIGAREKRRIGLRTLQSVVADASAALAANTLDRRDDWCLGAIRVTVDASGWEELVTIHQRALREVERVRRESAERLKESGEESLRTFSSVMLLELPE